MDKKPILVYHVNRVINCNCVFYDFSVEDSKKATNCNTKPFQYFDVFNESGEYNNTFFSELPQILQNNPYCQNDDQVQLCFMIWSEIG